jgi:hypothetical protein
MFILTQLFIFVPFIILFVPCLLGSLFKFKIRNKFDLRGPVNQLKGNNVNLKFANHIDVFGGLHVAHSQILPIPV